MIIDRITLLVHILRMAVEKNVPDKDHVKVTELASKTRDAMLGWYNDKPENMAKGKFVDELFKVARFEEKYRLGEIGKCTCSSRAPNSTDTSRKTAPTQSPSCMARTKVQRKYPTTKATRRRTRKRKTQHPIP